MKRILPFVALVALAIAFWSSGIVQDLSVARLLERREAMLLFVADNRVAAMGLYYLTFVALAAMAFPGTPLLSISSGFLFGGLFGGLLSVLGATSGGALLFLAARSGFAESLAKRMGPRLQRFREGFRADAASWMLFLRFVLAFPFWVVNIGSGLMGIRLRTFLWTTCLGVMPSIFSYAFAGAGLDKVLSAEIAAYQACMAAGQADCMLRLDPFALLRPELIFSLFALACLAVLPILLRRLRSAGDPRRS